MKRLIVVIIVALLALSPHKLALATAAALVDCSGTITLGGTAQALIAANAAKTYLLIQNIGVTNLGVSITNPPVIGAAGTVTITPGSSLVFEDAFTITNALYIIGPTTSQPFTCWRR